MIIELNASSVEVGALPSASTHSTLPNRPHPTDQRSAFAQKLAFASDSSMDESSPPNTGNTPSLHPAAPYSAITAPAAPANSIQLPPENTASLKNAEPANRYKKVQRSRIRDQKNKR